MYKNTLKQFQYRKYKEVYEVDLQIIKEVISKCDEFNYAFQEILEKYENKTKKQIGRMKETTNKLFIVIPKDNDNENKNEKNPKKKSSKKETKKPETEKKPKKKTSKKKSMNAP